MKGLVYVAALVLLQSCVPSNAAQIMTQTDEREYKEYIEMWAELANLYLTDPTFKADVDKDATERTKNTVYSVPESRFACTPDSTAHTPTSVHNLRPQDLKVVATMGDGLSAGMGMGANDALYTMVPFRGESWSGGGEDSLEEGVYTLPNMLKKMNPDVYGYANCARERNYWPSRLNAGKWRGYSRTAFEQSAWLLEQLQSDENVNFHQDWKVVTVLFGVADLCRSCWDFTDRYYQKTFRNNVERALDFMHNNFPRTLVNLVPPYDVTYVNDVPIGVSTLCPITKRLHCACGSVTNPLNSDELVKVQNLHAKYVLELEDLVNSGKYDSRDDFTVVMQPFTKEFKPPTSGSLNRPDPDYFSPDCVHPSRKFHKMFARELWNSMLTPVGSKPVTTDDNTDNYECPSGANRFIHTKCNGGQTCNLVTTTNKPGATTISGVTRATVSVTTCVLSLILTCFL